MKEIYSYWLYYLVRSILFFFFFFFFSSSFFFINVTWHCFALHFTAVKVLDRYKV